MVLVPWILGGAAAAASAALGWRILVHEPTAVALDRRELWFPDLPPSLDGLRLLFLADLHVRRWGFREVWLRDQAARLRPDLTLMAGDLAEAGGLSVLFELLPALAGARGTFMVPGNNESEEHDPAVLFQRLSAAGVTVLRNDAVALGDFRLLGVDDPHQRLDDLPAALARCPSGGFKLLLSHTPEPFAEAARAGVPLTLAGHTHGGQVRLPVVGALWTDCPRTGRRYDQGLFREGAATLLVTRGVGMSKLPVRLLCPPQVHELTLRRGVTP